MHNSQSFLMRMLRRGLLCMMHFAWCILLCGCYNRGPITPDAWNLTEQQLDSISFYTTHHYTQNYNFVVTGDSLVVVAQQPEAMAIPEVVSIEIESIGTEQQKDSITLRKNERIVVADIGHYESEHYTKEIFLEIIQKKNPTFAVAFAKNETNQVNYL